MSQSWWWHIAQKTLGEGSSHSKHQHKKPFKHMNNALVLNCTELCPKALQQAAKPSPCAATELRARATSAALGEGNLLASICGNEWEVLIVSLAILPCYRLPQVFGSTTPIEKRSPAQAMAFLAPTARLSSHRAPYLAGTWVPSSQQHTNSGQ